MTEKHQTPAPTEVAESLEQTQRMLAAVGRAQALFLTGDDSTAACDALLAEVLDLTGSAFGFIAEVLRDPDGAPYLKTCAITNIAWDDDSRRLYERHSARGIEFRNLDTLFGAAIRSGGLVIANSPASDPRSGGLPEGHPALDAFAGIPLRSGERLVGLVALANRPGGYVEEGVDALTPMLDTIRTLLVADRARRARARAESELRASAAENRRLAMVASHTSNLVFVTEADGAISWVNDAFTRVTGYTLDEARGRTPMRLLHGPMTDPEVVSTMAAHLARGEPVNGFEIVNYTKDGRPYWVSVEIQPVRDVTGAVVQYIAIESDVTASKNAQRSLRASEAKFAAAFHDSADYIVITRVSDGVFIEANAAALRLTGLSREQLIGQTALDLKLWADPAERDKLQAELRESGRVSAFACTLRTATGALRDCLMSATRIDIDGEACQLTLVHDITERREAERTMRESEQRLRALFDSAVDGIVVFDESGLIETANPACERMFGYGADEMRGREIAMLLPDAHASGPKATAGKTLAAFGALGAAGDAIALRRGGDPFPVEIVVAEMADSGTHRFSATIRDVSSRKQAEEAGKRLNDKLQVSVAALEQLNRDNVVMSELRDLLQTCQTVDEVIRVSTQFAPRLLDGTSGDIYLSGSARGLLEHAAGWGGGADDEAQTPIGTDDCWSLRRGRSFMVAPGEDALCCNHVTTMPRGGYICIPMTAQGETLGMLHMRCQAHAGQADAPAHGAQVDEGSGGRRRHLALTVAEYLALAIANVRMRETLRRQATRDALTGLYNRRHMDEVLEREIRRSSRQSRHAVVMMVDIDRFKQVNDRFGHEAGDLVLCEIARCLSQEIRQEDYAFRYGGEEFMLLLPDAKPECLRARAEAILDAARRLTLGWMGKPIGPITVSVGIAAFPVDGKRPGELVRAADNALYAAKRQGRDRAVLASELEDSFDESGADAGVGNRVGEGLRVSD